MTQAERDRLVALKKAKKKLITQKQAAEDLGVTDRQVRRLLCALKRRGDRVVGHGLREGKKPLSPSPQRWKRGYVCRLYRQRIGRTHRAWFTEVDAELQLLKARIAKLEDEKPPLRPVQSAIRQYRWDDAIVITALGRMGGLHS
jgi:hypothetical protein